MTMNKETFLAILRLIVPLIVAACSAFNITVEADFIYQIVFGALFIVTFVWSWWKNNNISSAAQAAQKILDELKSEK